MRSDYFRTWPCRLTRKLPILFQIFGSNKGKIEELLLYNLLDLSTAIQKKTHYKVFGVPDTLWYIPLFVFWSETFDQNNNI